MDKQGAHEKNIRELKSAVLGEMRLLLLTYHGATQQLHENEEEEGSVDIIWQFDIL